MDRLLARILKAPDDLSFLIGKVGVIKEITDTTYKILVGPYFHEFNKSDVYLI